MRGVGGGGTADDAARAGPGSTVVAGFYLISELSEDAVMDNRIVVGQIELTRPGANGARKVQRANLAEARGSGQTGDASIQNI